MKKEIIICVDDEKIVLNSLKAELKNAFSEHFIIETEESPNEALQTIDDLLESGYEIPVIISDYAMPSIKGDELLALVHKKSPRTLKILLTGQATIEGVVNSINNAGLFRYIEKPWTAQDLILTVEQAIKFYRQDIQLLQRNKELLELSQSLEEKVEERTSELSILNELLQTQQKEIIIQNEELEKHRFHLENLVDERTRELIIAKEKAEQNDKLKSAFLSNISHEVRTPLNGLLGFIDILNSPLDSREMLQEYLSIIQRCGKQVVEIITDIVAISMIETNQVQPLMGKCKLNSVRENLNAIFHSSFDANPDVRFVHSGIMDLVFTTDEIKLNQILSNLIGNALKNTKQGTIELGCSMEPGGNLLFFVKDSGVGISKEYHEVIFDRFRQVDTSLCRTQGGTGLGLAISKGYVELLGGKIWLESTPGTGSTFYISIPFIPVPGSTSAEMEIIPLKFNNHAGITILVAEDNDTNFRLLEIILGASNINVIRASNGEEAVNICRNNDEIDLVLMDIKMPVMGGIEATRQILEFRSGLPIIAQTAYAASNDNLVAINCGCVDYISKPIQIDRLIELISKHLVKQTSL